MYFTQAMITVSLSSNPSSTYSRSLFVACLVFIFAVSFVALPLFAQGSLGCYLLFRLGVEHFFVCWLFFDYYSSVLNCYLNLVADFAKARKVEAFSFFQVNHGQFITVIHNARDFPLAVGIGKYQYHTPSDLYLYWLPNGESCLANFFIPQANAPLAFA